MAFTRNGYGQVEPNQLSAQKTGQIYASLPLDKEVDVLQNGEFMFYDYVNGTVNCGKDGSAAGTKATAMTEPYLVFNEIKLYEPFWRTSYKDFAMIRKGDNYVTTDLATAKYGENTDKNQAAYQPHGEEYGYRMVGFAPRLFKTNIGDIFTTNMVKELDGDSNNYVIGDILVPVKNTNTKTLQLEKEDSSSGSTQVAAGTKWQVVKVYTMPDGQQGLKLQRVE
jgi:hypothetical protein